MRKKNLAILFIFFSVSAFAQVACTGMLAAPVINITFGSGATNPGPRLAVAVPGATTTYNYAAYATGTPPAVIFDGDYALINEVPANGAWFIGAKDHTGNANGYMAFFNAAPVAGEFYRQNIRGLSTDTTYEFSAWIANVINAAVMPDAVYPNITFEIVDSATQTVLGSYNTGDIVSGTSMKWTEYSILFTMPSGVSAVTLKLINNSIGGTQQQGNDLAVDDITFRPCLGAGQSCNDWLKISSDYSGVQIGKLNVPGNKVTVEAMFNRIIPNQGPAEPYFGDIVSKHNGPTDVNYLLRPDDAEITTTNGYFRTPDICNIDTLKTYYVAMVYDGSTLNFYRNGFLMSSVPATGNLFQNNWITTIGSLASKGATTYPEGLIGYINEVRIWNVAKTQAQLQQYMNTALPNPTTQSGLLAYYQFSSLINLQGNSAWNGSLIGGANINAVNPTCANFIADSCGETIIPSCPSKHNNFNTAFCFGSGVLIKSSFHSSAYNWNTNATDSFINVSQPGIYWVEGDSAQCILRDSFFVKENPLPKVFLGNDTSFCSGFKLILNAANAGSTYLWQNGSTRQTDTAAISGVYFVTVTDANKCSNSDTVKITVFSTPVISNLTNDTNICIGNKVQLNVIAAGNNMYQWLPSAGLSNADISNPVASPQDSVKYIIKVTSIDKCATEDSVIINVLPQPFLKKLNDTSICIGSSILLNTQPQNANVFLWQPSTGLSNPDIYNPTAVISSSITYILTAGNKVCSVNDTVSITALPLPVVSVSNDTTICGTSKAQLFATGGINYSWSPQAGLSDSGINDPIASPLVTTKYYVVVKDINQCAAKDSVLISVKAKPNFSVMPAFSNVCTGDSTAFIASGSDSYQWLFNNLLISIDSFLIVHPHGLENYQVILTSAACKVIDTFSVQTDTIPLARISIAKSNDINCILGISNLSASGGNVYTWMPANSLSNANISNPVASPVESTMYYVTAKDSNGCTEKDSIKVFVTKGNSQNGYLVPSAFTPNGDGKNDCFGVKEWGTVTAFDLSVYNRWGDLMFHTNNSGDCWNGTYEGMSQAAGAYIYQIKGEAACGNIYRKGTVILIR